MGLGFVLLIIGTGQISRAQESIKREQLLATPRAGLDYSWQGSRAGLEINQWNGSPGVQSTISLRGLNIEDLGFSKMPLVLINGVPIISDPSIVTEINPLAYYTATDIKRVDVIKDISLLAKYGSRGANGAINIITKSGETGALHVDFYTFAGGNIKPANRDMIIGNGERDRLIELYSKGMIVDPSVQYPEAVCDSLNSFYSFANDTQDPLYESSLIHEEGISINGGGDYGSYYIGLNNHIDNGVKIGTSFQRQTITFNALYNITDKFIASFFNNATLTNRERLDGNYIESSMTPLLDNETYFGIDTPFSDDEEYMDKNKNIGLLSAIGLQFELSEKLSLSSKFGISYEGARRDHYIPSTLLNGNVYALSMGKKRQMISLNGILSYNHLMTESALKLDGGVELISKDNRLTYIDGERSIESGGSNYVKIVSGYNNSQIYGMSDYHKENLISGFIYGGYKKDSGLEANLTLRVDGSSQYENKWTLYPSVSVKYDLSKSNNTPVILSGGIGLVGQNIEQEAYRGEMAALGEYYEGIQIGVEERYQPNSDSQGVKVLQYNLAATYQIDDKLSIKAEYFSKWYSDFSYLRYLPNISGDDFEYESGLGVAISGFEFTLEGDIVDKSNFKWYTNLNISTKSNKITELPSDLQNSSLERFAGLKEGESSTSILAYKSNGYYTNSEQISTSPTSGKGISYDGIPFSIGMPNIADQNGDLIIDQSDRVVIGDSQSKLFGGFTNRFTFKDLSIEAKFTFAAGGDIATESFSERFANDNYSGGQYYEDNTKSDMYNISSGSNNTMVIQGISSIQSSSFIRFSDLKIGYNLQSIIENSLTIVGLDAYLFGANLLTISSYNGLNPEECQDGVRDFDLGDCGTPLPATYGLGVNIIF